MARTRFQSVDFALAEVFPVRFSFMTFCSPCRNDAALPCNITLLLFFGRLQR